MKFLAENLNEYSPLMVTILAIIVFAKWVIPYLKANKSLATAKQLAIIADNLVGQYEKKYGKSMSSELINQIIDVFVEVSSTDKSIATRIIEATLADRGLKTKEPKQVETKPTE
mgnify:CR=1 FL=1